MQALNDSWIERSLMDEDDDFLTTCRERWRDAPAGPAADDRQLAATS